MTVYEIISKKIKNEKEFTIEEIEQFYNSLTYKEYKQMKNKLKEERIKIYLDYQKKTAHILKFLKNKLKQINEDYFLNKNILSIHIKAIKDSKDIKLNNKQEIEAYGYNYGWLEPENYKEEKFYECGVILINNLKKIELSSKYCDTLLCKYAQYYEWRKIIWMKLFLLIKDVDKNYLEQKAKDSF